MYSVIRGAEKVTALVELGLEVRVGRNLLLEEGDGEAFCAGGVKKRMSKFGDC